MHQWAEFYDGKSWVPVDCSLAQEEKKDFFGKFDDYRIIISKDMNFRLIKNGILPFLQIGNIKPKESNILLKVNTKKIN